MTSSRRIKSSTATDGRVRFAFHFHSSRVAAAANVDLFSRSISRGSYILTRASFTSHCTIRHDLRINADRPVFDSVATVSEKRTDSSGES